MRKHASKSDLRFKVWQAAIYIGSFAASTLWGQQDVAPIWVAFSPDGKKMAVAEQQSQKVIVFDPSTEKKITEFGPTSPLLYSVAFSPDGKLLASAEYRCVKLWDAVSGKLVATMLQENDPDCLAFSPDSQTLATAIGFWGSPRQIYLFEIPSGKIRRSFKIHDSGNSWIAFSPKGKILAAAERTDSAIVLWDVRQAVALGKLVGHKEGVSYLAFSPNGDLLASGGSDKAVRLWDMKTRHQTALIPIESEEIRCLAFGMNGKLLAIGTYEGNIEVWDVTLNKPLTSLTAFSVSVRSVSFSDEHHLLAATDWGNSLKIWNTKTWVEIPFEIGK